VQQELNVRQGVMKERDELKVQLTAAQGQFEQFRKSIKTLLGQAESASAPTANQPTAATIEDTAANKS